MPSNILKSGYVHMVDDIVYIKDALPRRKRAKKPEGEPTEQDFTPLELDEAAMEGPIPEGEADAYDDYDEAYEGGASAHVKEEIIQAAMGEAGRILEDAVHQAEQRKTEILAEAQQHADLLLQQGMEEGRRQGFATVSEEMKEIAGSVQQAIAEMEGGKAGFEVEYEEQLKWMAVEIASKVLSKKVHQDDAEMTEMVDKAVQGVRGESWVRVEVARDMTRLIDRLRSLYQGDENIDVVEKAAPDGSVLIESPSGVIDASLDTQLQNLKNYFEKAGI